MAIIFRNLGRPVSLSKYTAPTSASIIEPLNSTTNNSSIHPLDYENVKIAEADLLMSACLWHEGKSQHISYKSLFGSWDYVTANRSDHESLNLATKVMATVTRVDDEHEVTIENNITSHVLPVIAKSSTLCARCALLGLTVGIQGRFEWSSCSYYFIFR